MVSRDQRTEETRHLDRRRAAARRLAPLSDLGVADPWDVLRSPVGPQSFGLFGAEQTAEVERCQTAEWAGWELRARFRDPRTVDPAGVPA